MDFSLILFLLVCATGLIWGLDHLIWAPRRRRGTPAAKEPVYVEYARAFFPVILIVFLLRSFLVEPFRIPSGSMLPTLHIGDLILVNKYAYGVRLPVIHTKIIDVGSPQRGDVMVFRFPHNTSQDYIKRVVGLPGDRVEYLNRRLIINGEPVPLRRIERYFEEGRVQYYDQYVETLGRVEHRIIVNDGPGVPAVPAYQHTHPQACRYTAEGVSCTVPPGHYFVMGDNRDNSEDSRFWGFVPEGNIVGRAFFIWMNFGNIGRIGSFD